MNNFSNFRVEDETPIQWSELHGRNITDTVITGSIVGLSNTNQLVDPSDPDVITVGVIITIYPTYYSHVGCSIFTNGDNYWRLTMPSRWENMLESELTLGDAEVIKKAIADDIRNVS